MLLSSRSPIVREAIRKVLGRDASIRIVGEARSSRQTVNEAMRLNPNCVLMDVDMPRPTILNVIRRIREASEKVRILVFGLFEEPALIRLCLKAGANGCVPLQAGSAELLRKRHAKDKGKETICLRTFRSPPKGYVGRGKTRVAQWAILGIMTCTLSAPAQEARNFYFSSPISVSVVREKQLPLAKTQVDDFATILTLPGLSLGNVLPRTEVSLSYYPEFELFSKYKELNAWNHTVRSRFSHKISPRLTFAASDLFLQTRDPSRSLRDSVFLLPRSRFRENIFSLTLDYRLSPRTTFAWGFDHTVSFLSLPGFPPSDQMAGALTGSVSRMVSPQHRLTASYSFIALRDLNAGDTSSPVLPVSFRQAHSANLAYGYASERGMFFELSGGGLRSQGNSYTVSGRIGKNWTSFSVDGGYSRQVSIFRVLGGQPDPAGSLTSGLLPGSLYQLMTLNLAGTIGGHLGVELRASAGKNSTALPNGDLRSLTSRLRFAYRVSDRFFPFVGADFYGQNFNDLIQAPLARKRFLGGLTIFLSPPSELVKTQPGNLEAAWPVGIPGLVSRDRSRSESSSTRSESGREE